MENKTISVKYLMKILATFPEDAEVWVCSSSGRHETSGVPYIDDYVKDGKTVRRITLESDW